MPTEKLIDLKKKTTVEISCPKIIKEYNHHMSGVDLFDSLIGRYKIKMRSRKWYMCIWYHLIDITIVNAWLLYRRVETEKGNRPNMTLFDFRVEIAISLTKVGKITTPKRGRPSFENISAERKKGLLQCPLIV